MTRYRYASVGKPQRVSALGAVMKMAYDEAGNRLTLSDPDAGTTRSTYAADGTPLTETDARGVVTAHTYDDLGRLVSSQVGGTIVTRTYGTVGNERLRLVKETAGGNTVEYTHDALGRVVTESGMSTATATTRSPMPIMKKDKSQRSPSQADWWRPMSMTAMATRCKQPWATVSSAVLTAWTG